MVLFGAETTADAGGVDPGTGDESEWVEAAGTETSTRAEVSAGTLFGRDCGEVEDSVVRNKRSASIQF